ncbi:isopentenyl phosphate kinase family protein [Candidatus Bathyarchaeota archaeon]|nr:isopentenyl phosphate kinase family protein [Candidatus Bathyarchaeota archaeon]
MKDTITVLKLGGSVITDKKKLSTPNIKAIKRLAKEISQSGVSPLILVHGGGSFGHPIAKKYKINEGYNDPSQLMGFSKTQREMKKLNFLVMDSLMNYNINAVAVHPSSCFLTKSGRIQNVELKPIEKMIELGLIPVLHGDAVFDSNKGFNILSGDQLVSSLALNFGASRIIMGGDIDGVYSDDPKTNLEANLIPRITLEELKIHKYRIKGSKATDVTGGMLGKMQELIPAIEQNIQTLIVNATKPLRVYSALTGEEVIGTIVEKV